MTRTLRPTRRQFVAGAGATAALAATPAFIRGARAAGDFKIGMFYAIAGPASLFGPTQIASAQLAVSEINAAGGILGRQVKLVVSNGDAPPAEAAKAAVRLMLNDKVDFFLGSHNSAVRQALVATIKGRTPYVYTPIYEGGECARNTYVIADTPQQQIDTAVPALAATFGSKTFYLIGNDYVWPQVMNQHTRRVVAALGGRIMGEEYVPLGAPNKFEEAVTRIKAAGPDMVLSTLVGADNVNFNRTFAGFGLDKRIKRIAWLLEENTLLGIGAENSSGLHGCLSYYANIESATNKAFKARFQAKFGAKAPILSLLGEDCYSGVKFIEAVVRKAGSADTAKVEASADGLGFGTPTGRMTMHNRHVDKNMFLAECRGTEFKVIKTFENVSSGQTCA